MNNKRAVLGITLLLVISFVLPYLILKVISSQEPDLKGLVLMSLLLNLFLSFPLVLIEMMVTKTKGNSTKTIKKIEHSLTVNTKQVVKDKFEVPLFLLPMSITVYMAAKALEKDDTYYVLKSKLHNKEVNIVVKKEVFENTQEGQEIKVVEEIRERQYNLCWFEMALLSKFKDYVIEDFSEFKLNSFS